MARNYRGILAAAAVAVLVPASASGLTFNNYWNPSVETSPYSAQYKSGILPADAPLTTHFNDPVTLNLRLGSRARNGSALV